MVLELLVFLALEIMPLFVEKDGGFSERVATNADVLVDFLVVLAAIIED